ncbi:major allergen Pru av 1-like [Gastrolobium bilobum]|uniref:major allergen Pru av 1-like n=1 Tax=Gastrolobium bilobum TaxID=150636 RepID=UPI002AAF6D6C|nr:major allergen Pru av 1-like [Gastrolobium bilobum]
MGIFTYEDERVSSNAPARLYKAIVLDSSNVFPKVLPDFIKSVEIIEGDGGPGSIKKLTFAEGYVKQKVDAVDAENYVYHYSVIEGHAWPHTLENIYFELKMVESPDGGCIIKSITKYYTKGEAQLPEEFLKANRERIARFTKAIDDYLFANPDYN